MTRCATAGRCVAAVETGWNRARRTILAADAVNFLAAAVLYFLAASNVRGFAFTLGLTTLIDLLVVFLFTHPVVAHARATPSSSASGHKWSGLDPRAARRQDPLRRPRPVRRPRPTPQRQDPGDRVARPRTDRRPLSRGRPDMPNFAQFGNDLYTGKRSVDFVGRQKTWYAHLGRPHRRSPSSASSPGA